MGLIKPLRDRYITVGNINTRYWFAGEQGTTVILLHGLGSSVETWAYTITALAQVHQVYAIDLIGSGLTDKPSAAYSLLDQAQFIKTFIDTLNLGRVSLIGNSMGGGVALQMALIFPECIDKIVLANSLGLGQDINLTLRLASLPFTEPLLKPTRPSTEFLLKQIVYDSSVVTDDWVDTFYQINSSPGIPKALHRQITAAIDIWGVRPEVWRSLTDGLPGITAPALVIWGQQDPVLPVAHAQVAATRLPNVQLQIFEQCGHWPQVEQPEQFNKAVLEFLSYSNCQDS